MSGGVGKVGKVVRLVEKVVGCFFLCCVMCYIVGLIVLLGWLLF